MDLDSVRRREITLRMFEAGVSVYIDSGTVVTVSGATLTYVGAVGAAAIGLGAADTACVDDAAATAGAAWAGTG